MAKQVQQSRLYHWLLGGLLLVCLLFYSILIERRPIEWDALGYRVAGANIAQGVGPAIEHPLNQDLGPYFTLAAFAVQRPQEPARLYLNYPPGFPLLLALPQWVGLPDWFLLPVLSTLGVFFTCWLGSSLFDRWTGLLGAAIVAFTPIYLEWGTSFWADLPATCFLVGALAVYLIGCHQRTCKRQIVGGSIAGAMVVLAMFIKYSSVLVLLPLCAYAVITQRKKMFVSVVSWAFAVTVAAGLVGVGLYNRGLYGSPFETFYSASRSGFSFPIFSFSYVFGPSPVDGYGLITAARTLWANFSWLIALAIGGLTRAKREAIILLGGLFLVFLALSSMYAWAPKGVDTRYLLPLLTPLGLFIARGFFWALDVCAPLRKWMLGLLLVAVAVTFFAALPGLWRRLEERNHTVVLAEQLVRQLTNGSEPDAVFLAYFWNDRINYLGGRLTCFYRRMNLNDRENFETTLTFVVTRLLDNGRQVFYVQDRDPALGDSLDVLRENFTLDLWKETPIPTFQITRQE